MADKKISVIIPVYNAEKYITQCIESVLQQTFQSIEIVVVNDGSTDRTPEIVSEYASKYENIKVVSQENQGLFKARVNGFRASSGKYVGWIDADDFVKPTMFEKLYDKVICEQADFVNCDYDFYPEKNEFKEKWFKEYKGSMDWMFLERNMQPWCKLVDRALIEENNILSLWPSCGDGVYYKIALCANKIATVNEPLYCYRVGHESMSGGTFKGKTKHYIDCVAWSKATMNFSEGTKYQGKLDVYFEYLYVYALIQLCCVSAYNSERDIYMNAKMEMKPYLKRTKQISKDILDFNYGKLKSFVLRVLIPNSYFMAKVSTQFAFH